MASYAIYKNSTLDVFPYSDYPEQGWSVSDNIASHSGCNSGYIKQEMDLSAAAQWTFEYTVLALTSGIVRLEVGDNVGTNRSAAGVYTETVTIDDPDTVVRFYATGVTSLQLLKVYPSNEYVDATTFAFNEDANRWVGNYSFTPERLLKFGNDFFTFLEGELWQHNRDDVPRNNFYGVQYTTKLTFVFNENVENNKILCNIRLDGKGNWAVPLIETEKTDTFPNGMQSRIKSGNFKIISGKKWADFKRDMTDPRFHEIVDPAERQLKALMGGRELQGSYAELTFECEDTVEAKLKTVEIFYSEVEHSL